MVLSIEDETDNRLRLVKDGIGVEFTGKLPYNTYFVYSCSFCIKFSSKITCGI